MFLAFIMKAMGDIDWIRGFDTEAEADAFGIERTSYSELSPLDDPDHWKKYDPPVVILFESNSDEASEAGKYKRPVAIYQRGEKFICVKA